MSVDSAIAHFRRRQADVFRDEAILERPSGTTTFDPETGTEVPGPPTPVHTGPCLIRAFKWEGTDAEAGGVEARLRRFQVKFDVDVDARKDDIVRPIASTYDGSLVGRSFRVTDVARDGWQISRWLICEEIIE